MGFNITSWLLRQRIDAQARMPGRTMEHSRVVNPFHAVSVEPGQRACKEVRRLEDRRILATAAPRIPLPECTSPGTCKCRYVHYDDRRSRRDRRVLPHNPHAHKMSDRRSGSGRRMSD